MQKILEDSETAGGEFKVDGGIYQILVEGWVATLDLEIQTPNGTWIETNQQWSDDGVKAMYLAAAASCRMEASAAGAEAWLQPLRHHDINDRI